LCTGTSSRHVAASLALVVALLAPGSGRAQTFKLSTLRIPADATPGSWVAYQVDLVSKNRPPRKVLQRIAVVSREGTGSESGAWVELKTSEAGRTRTERGFFMKPEARRGSLLDSLFADEAGPPEPDSLGGTPAASVPKLRLARYQKLTPDGKLYEYPMDEEGTSLPEEDISAIDMFEFSGRGTADSLSPDTLRVGRKVVPCRVRRVTRQGSQGWEGDDSTYTNRARMATTVWRNPWIPVTGIARKIVEVSSERVPVPGSTAASDSAATNPAPSGSAPASDFFYRATVALVDLGNDAVPEITQAPEPAPRESAPHPRILDR
jgi:hypothetical protein